DAGRDAAPGHNIAVAYDSAGIRYGAEGGEQLAPGPMAGGALAAQQSGGAEHQRAGTHRRHIARAVGEAAQLAQEFGVADRIVSGAEPGRYAHDIASLDIGEPAPPAKDNPVGLDPL